MNRKNICFFLGSYGTGGAEDHVLQIIRNLNYKDFNISLVVFKPIGKNANEFHELDINIYELPVYSNKIVKHFLRLFNFIPITLFLLRSKITVVHIHLVGIYLTSMLSSILAGVSNRIITWHNVYDGSVIVWNLKNVIKNIRFIFRVKITSILSNRIVAVSQNVADSNIKYFHINKKKVFTIHNGIKSNSLTRPINKSRDSLKLIAVGSLTKQKGYFVMLDAISKLSNKYNNTISLDIFGDGPLYKKIDKKIRNLGLVEQVKLKGRVNNIPELLPSYDVYINTSFHEGFSIAVLEAMNAQLGIIATSVGGTPEAIIDNYSGLLVDKNNSKQVADSIAIFYNDSKLLAKLAMQARKLFLDKFSVDNMIFGLINLYDK